MQYATSFNALHLILAQMVVYPRHAFPELAQAKHNSRWIWQLKEIVIR